MWYNIGAFEEKTALNGNDYPVWLGLRTFTSAADGRGSEQKGVAVTCRLADCKAQRQRLSRNRESALRGKIEKNTIEVWLSLVERYVRDVEVASSNLVTSTKIKKGRLTLPFLIFD